MLVLIGFYLAREYVVSIMLFLTDFILPEYVVPIIWIETGFYLAREYVVPIMMVLTGFILPEGMWFILCCF